MGQMITSAHLSDGRRTARVILGLLGMLAGWAVVRQQPLAPRDAALGLTLVCASAATLVWDYRRGALAAPFLFLYAFWLFHTGLLVSYAVAGQSVIYNPYYAWVATVDLAYAVVATAWAVTAFAAGVLLARRLPRHAVGRDVKPGRLGLIGTVTGSLGLVYVFGTYALNASSILAGGYGGYLDAAGQGSLFGYAQALVAIGCVMAVAADGRARTVGWTLFLMYSLTALAIGARGSALFPLLALLAVEGRRWRLRLWVLAVASVVGLTTVSVIRQARHLGLLNLFSGKYDYSPLGGMSEIGQSFYPILVVQNWMDGGLEPAHGDTVIVNFLRAIESLTGSAPPAVSDPRLLNVEILQMAGPVGSSPVAEGIRNGGLIGVVLLVGLLGLVVGAVSRRLENPWQAAVLGVVLSPILVAVRNVLAPVLVQVVLGLALIALARHLDRHNRTPRGADRPPGAPQVRPTKMARGSS